MLSRFADPQSGPRRPSIPGAGVFIVYRQQMRARNAWYDLIWTCLLVCCHGGLALLLQWSLTPSREYGGDISHFLTRWLTMCALGGPILTMPIAAVLGALAAPAASQFEETQSMLLTRLTPFDLCCGRLVACLWPVLSEMLAFCALSLTVQLAWRPLALERIDGYIAIIVVSLVLLSAVLAIGTTGFLFALRGRPGRVLARGIFAGIALAALSVTGLFLVNPVVRRLDNPTGLITEMLLVNPSIAATSALRVDILRLPWLYERTDAPEYPFSYPEPLATCAVFGGGAVAMLGMASARLRRAYR